MNNIFIGFKDLVRCRYEKSIYSDFWDVENNRSVSHYKARVNKREIRAGNAVETCYFLSIPQDPGLQLQL